MNRRLRQNLILLLVSSLVAILGTEAALSVFDPWGMHYFDDLATIWDHTVADSHRIDVLPPGTYNLSNWTVTQLDGNVRLVPDNQGGKCKVVFLGDSVTWGHGVNDKDTWVNLVASQLPGTNVINAAFEGYNSENVRGTLQDFPDANLVVYLIIGNDAEPTTGLLRQTRASMIRKYLAYMFRGSVQATGSPPDPGNTQRFPSDIKKISQDKRVVLFGFEEPLAESLKPDFDVTLIPLYHHTNSKVDPHANAAGNQEIAAEMLPYLRTDVAKACSSYSNF